MILSAFSGHITPFFALQTVLYRVSVWWVSVCALYVGGVTHTSPLTALFRQNIIRIICRVVFRRVLWTAAFFVLVCSVFLSLTRVCVQTAAANISNMVNNR